MNTEPTVSLGTTLVNRETFKRGLRIINQIIAIGLLLISLYQFLVQGKDIPVITALLIILLFKED